MPADPQSCHFSPRDVKNPNDRNLFLFKQIMHELSEIQPVLFLLMQSLSKPQSVKMALQRNLRFSALPPDLQVENHAKSLKPPIFPIIFKKSSSWRFCCAY